MVKTKPVPFRKMGHVNHTLIKILDWARVIAFKSKGTIKVIVNQTLLRKNTRN